MINLDKLNSQFDINNIDPAQIVKVLTENQKPVMGVIAIGALLIAAGMFNDHHAKEIALHARITQEQAKLEVIKSRDKATKDLADFKSLIPKELNVFELVTLIQTYAKSYNVTINSYTPNQTKDMGIYNAIVVRFDVSADDFKSMMYFLRKIERSNYPIMINNWSGHEGDGGKISFTIDISAVHLHP